MNESWLEIAAWIGAYVFFMPLATYVANDVYTDQKDEWKRKLVIIFWLPMLVGIWFFLILFGLMTLLKKIVFNTFKPLHDRGLLPEWAKKIVNKVLWTLTV